MVDHLPEKIPFQRGNRRHRLAATLFGHRKAAGGKICTQRSAKNQESISNP
jgi:hypothetical protein